MAGAQQIEAKIQIKCRLYPSLVLVNDIAIIKPISS